VLKLGLDAVLSHVQSSSDLCWYAERGGGVLISRLRSCRSHVLLYGAESGCYCLRFSLLSKIIVEA
jgi:hypothetical protein